MAFQVSPGVNISEVDLSTTIPNVSVSDAAMAAGFQWGPANVIQNITSERLLLSTYGKPDDDTKTNWLTAASFLAYAGSLQVVRSIDEDTAKNATDEYVTGGEGGAITGAVTVVDGGTGYVDEEIVTIDNNESWGNNAVLRVTVAEENGIVTSVVIFNNNYGSGYTTGTQNTTSDVGSSNNDLTVSFTATTIVASDVATGILVESETAYDAGINFLQDVSFVARYPGTYGNSIGVGLVHKPATWATADITIGTTPYTWSSLFDDEPNASGETQYVHVLVTDVDGKISGTVGEILEKHAYASLATDGKDDQGNSNFLPEVLRRNSKYIYATGHFDGNNITGATNWDYGTITSTFSSCTVGYAATLAAGASDNGSGTQGANNTANRTIGYDKFADSEQTDVSLVVTGQDDDGTLSVAIEASVIGVRKDCVLFVSPAQNDVVSNASLSDKSSAVVTAKGQKPSSSRSYIVMDSGWKRMYNKYTDKFDAVPLNGDIAGLCVATDNNADTWFSPAGFSRGGIKNAASLYFNPDKTNRDTLYKAGINPVASFPGEGIVLFGDKTLQSKPSAFDRINVRRLFIVLEKTISRAARSMLFEFNDEFTRAQFRSIVEPFLRSIKARRGVTDYQVVCDTTNNTADVIDRNEFVGDIFVKPARSINYIQLNFVAVSTGVSFDEVVGAV